jgi:FMN-dependent NADH-azoreductase
MPHLLHIDASAVPNGSVSRAVAATFRDGWNGTVTYRDLGSRPVPHLTEAGITARGTDEAARSAEQATAAFLQDELVKELLEADAYLFAVPMYNFAIPSTFKAWLDHILIPGRTMGGSPADSPLSGRPATLVNVRGGAYGPGTPREGWDFAAPYLEQVLTQSLGLDLHVITAEMTLATTHPALEQFRDHMAASIAQAHEGAAERARGLTLQQV